MQGVLGLSWLATSSYYYKDALQLSPATMDLVAGITALGHQALYGVLSDAVPLLG